MYHWTAHFTGGMFGQFDPDLGSTGSFKDPIPGPARRRAARNPSRSEHNARLTHSIISGTMGASSPRPPKKTETPILQLVDLFNNVLVNAAAGQKEDPLTSIPEAAHGSSSPSVRYSNRARGPREPSSSFSNKKRSP